MAQFGRRISPGHEAARRSGQLQSRGPFGGLIGSLGQRARDISGAVESQFQGQPGFATQFAQHALPKIAQGGFSPAEDIAARRGITGRVRSLIGGASTQGARGGFFSPDRAARTGQRAATTALAPALVQHQANVARSRREGLQEAGRLAVPLAQGEQRSEEQRRAAFGGLLGRLLRRNTGIPRGRDIGRSIFA